MTHQRPLSDRGVDCFLRTIPLSVQYQSQKLQEWLQNGFDARDDLLHVVLPEPRHQLRDLLT